MKNIRLVLLSFVIILSAGFLTAKSQSDSQNSARWWENAVFYEIFVRSFYDSDGNGVGDFNGITAKLDYLNDGKGASSKSLGINALWLTPIFKCGSYHGYDIEDYYAVNREFGTMEDFERLLKEAHKRGIKVVLDLVINHTSARNPWFIASSKNDPVYKDYYVWTNEKPVGWTKQWVYNRDRGEYFYATFGGWMPDLNQNNPAVFSEMKKIAKFWLDKGVDGFRLDAARHLIEEGPGDLELDTESTQKYWEKFNSYVKSVNPNAMLVGEVWTKNESVSKYYRDGKGLDLCFDFSFSEKMVLMGGYGNAAVLRETLMNKQGLNAPLSFYAPFLANHDQVRIMNAIQTNMEKAKMLAAILLTSPGTPFLYYGEEIGMFQQSGNDDQLKRTPMQWDSSLSNCGFTTAKRPWFPLVTTSAPYTVAFQQTNSGSLLETYKKLLRIRAGNPEFTGPVMQIIDCGQEHSIAIKRESYGGDRSYVLVNGETNAVDLSCVFLQYGKFTDLFTGKPFTAPGGKVTLRGCGFLVLKEIKRNDTNKGK